ncbi:thioredoxin family protein [Ulvibacter antarcticus]|uniref:Thioredoxin-related protein n=1 Tax=Ulvibacter antarcticus TaxID=442714 RepID=A0A3L9Z0V1_9FLAO|nr:thioredoxin family protein [Ulvibacter antarcticus]RMA66486.1 thioredoxin-related protein [Ulvibacter antarcticus]
MNKLVLVIFLLVVGSVSAQKINWMSMDEALAAQTKVPKLIMVDMYTNWCGPCKMMDRDTFNNQDVADYVNEHYYAVKFNAEGNDVVNFNYQTFSNPDYNPAKANKRNGLHEFSRYVGIRAYPTVVFINNDMEVITAVKSYLTPQGLELYLKVFATGKYLSLTSQESFNAYSKNFKSEFRG